MDKKELKKQYAQSIPPMGIFQVRNLVNEKLFIDSGLNLEGKINRTKFQLKLGSHRNRALQEDYNKMGPENFAFEVVDRLKPKDDLKMDYTDDLKMLETLWLEKLQPFDAKGYNPRQAKS